MFFHIANIHICINLTNFLQKNIQITQRQQKQYLVFATKKTFFASSAAENFVLVSLLAQGFHLPHYWSISGNKAEVDFLIQDGIDVSPVEVKAERNISGQSLKVYQEKYNPKLRVRFSMKNLNINGNILNVPIFLCDWLKSILDFASERMTD